MTPTSASGAAFTGRPGQIRPPTWSSGSCDRTATTRTGRSAAKPRSRSARALAASSLSALITSSTRAGSAMVVRAGPYLSTTAAAAMASRSSSTSSSGPGGPGRSSHTVPISSSSRVIGAALDAGTRGRRVPDRGASATSLPSGDDADHPSRAVEPDAGHALGQARRGPGERWEIHPSAHQRVVEHDDADRAFDLRVQMRQPCGQCLHGRRIGADRRVNWAGCRDGWRMISGWPAVRMVDMDPELEAFIPLFPRADLTDPVPARTIYAELAASAPAPDTSDMEIEDRTVPADPEVPVRIYRPHRGAGRHRLAARRRMRHGRPGHRAPVGRAARGRLRRGGDLGGLPAGPRAPVPGRPGRRLRGAGLGGRAGGRTRHRPGADRGRRPQRRRGSRGRGGVAGTRRAGAADPLPAAQPARTR